MQLDVIIVGSGVAGTVCAHTLAEAGLSVGILNKNSDMLESNTYYAQGGIVYEGQGDSPDLLFEDVMKAGADICNPEAVKILAEEAGSAVREVLIEKFQVAFTKNEHGELDLTDEGAHSTRRIVHSFDTTGRSIEESAMKTLSKFPNIHFFNDTTAVDIITLDHHTRNPQRMYQGLTALGVYALNHKTGQVETLRSRAVVLACGGMGQIFLHTTNPASATGDGFAMASRAGARLVNMEYTQFHPTTLYHPKADNFLISESMRGEGAVLLSRDGKPFMERYHPLKDLAPRDIVTRAILNEMLDTGEKFVYLDTARIGKSVIEKRFPNIARRCKEYGIDITQEPVPVVPAYHFSCGGVLTDTNGKTTIGRLYAAGEVACNGLHGANRLASTSLLEGVIFGRRTARSIIDFLKNDQQNVPADVVNWIDTGIEAPDIALIHQDWNFLKNIMWNYVGAIRNEKRLRRAVLDLNNLKEDIEDFYRDAKLSRGMIELRNGVQAGLIVAKQALANRQSIGAHYRLDA